VKRSFLKTSDSDEVITLQLNEKGWEYLIGRPSKKGVVILEEGVIKGSDPERILELNYLTLGRRVVTSLSADQTLVRHLEVPIKKRAAVMKALPFQIENRLPISLDETVVIPWIERKKRRSVSDVTLIAAKKEAIEATLKELRTYYISPDILGSEVVALYRYAQTFYPSSPDMQILHVGETSLLAICIQGGRLMHSFSLDISSPEDLHVQLERLFAYFEEKGLGLSPYLVTRGEERLAPILIEKGFQIIPSKIDESVASPICYGLACSLNGAQFLEVSPLHKREVKRHIKRGVAISLTLLAFTYALGSSICHLQMNQLTHRLDGLMESLGESLTPSMDFATKMRRVNKVLKKGKGPSLLQKEPPRVADFLAYLSHHPMLQGDDLTVESLCYELVSHPTVKAQQVPYGVKVELFLHADTGVVASEFYDNLRNECPILDPKKEITWKRKDNGYHVSFTLK